MTLQGWVGGDVMLRTAGETVVANFRVACTPRRFSRKTQEWVDGADPVVHRQRLAGAGRALPALAAAAATPWWSTGALNSHTYINKAGVEITDLEVEATFVGHDLSRGTSAFTRAARPGGPVADAAAAGKEAAAA